MKRARRWYAAALSVLVAAVAVTAVVIYLRGETGHVTYRPAARPPQSLALAPTGENLTRRWATADDTASGTPFDSGTVVTYDAHTVRGRSALSGAVTWSYGRSDRKVCAVLQSFSVTVALYRRSTSCDEVSAFATSTGRRSWTRTLDEDAALFDGSTTVQVYQDEMLFVSRTSVYAVAVGTGVDYWVFNRPGCSIGSATLGQSGALISMQCSQPYCPGQRFCRKGPQLLLRPAANPTGVSQTQKDKNPAYIVWDIPNPEGWVPATAGPSISAISRAANTLSIFNAANGDVRHTLTLRSAEGTSSQPVVTSYNGDFAFVWYGGYVYAQRRDTPAFAWQARADNPPTVNPNIGDTGGTGVRIYVTATANTVTRIDAETGRTLHRYRLAGLPSASTAYPLGAGLLSAGSATAYYG